MSLDDKKKVILKRYGSLTNFERVVTSQPQICRELRIPPSTVSAMLRNFIRQGHRLDLIGQKYVKFSLIPADI